MHNESHEYAVTLMIACRTFQYRVQLGVRTMGSLGAATICTPLLFFCSGFDTRFAKALSTAAGIRNLRFPSYMFTLFTEVVFRNLVTLMTYGFARRSHYCFNQVFVASPFIKTEHEWVVMIFMGSEYKEFAHVRWVV